MKPDHEMLLETISTTAWRSATDIARSFSNSQNTEKTSTWVNLKLKGLEQQGVIEKMKNRNRVFYRQK